MDEFDGKVTYGQKRALGGKPFPAGCGCRLRLQGMWARAVLCQSVLRVRHSAQSMLSPAAIVWAQWVRDSTVAVSHQVFVSHKYLSCDWNCEGRQPFTELRAAWFRPQAQDAARSFALYHF